MFLCMERFQEKRNYLKINYNKKESMEKITQLSQLDSNSIYNYADYLTWQFEQSVALIHGKIFQRASPNRKHQTISWELSGPFYNFFRNRRCQAYTAPFDVRLYDKKKSLKANKDIFTVVQQRSTGDFGAFKSNVGCSTHSKAFL
jgi:hypothetical protein